MTTFTYLCYKYCVDEGYFHIDFHPFENFTMSKGEKEIWGENYDKHVFTIVADNGETHTIPHYYHNSREEKIPDEMDIIHELFYEAHNEACYTTFKEWCDNCGYDNDSIKALKIYHSCKRLARAFKRLCTPEMYKEFMECEDDY